jgi:hypothetical protein
MTNPNDKPVTVGDYLKIGAVLLLALGLALILVPFDHPQGKSAIAPWMTNQEVWTLSDRDYNALLMHRYHPSNAPLPDHLKPKAKP